jgi:hypothetical protein
MKDNLEQILVGQPIESAIDEAEFNYYYLKYSEKHVVDKPVYIVLNTVEGDADVYV